jgi:hypothetical protein
MATESSVKLSTGEKLRSVFGEAYVREGLLRLTAREALRRFRLLLNDPEGFARHFAPPEHVALAAQCDSAFAEYTRAAIAISAEARQRGADGRRRTSSKASARAHHARESGAWDEVITQIGKRSGARALTVRERRERQQADASLASLEETLSTRKLTAPELAEYRRALAVVFKPPPPGALTGRQEAEYRRAFAELAASGDALASAWENAWRRAFPDLVSEEPPINGMPNAAQRALLKIREDYRWWLEGVLPHEARLRVIGRLVVCKLTSCERVFVRPRGAPAQQYCPRCRHRWPTKQKLWYAAGGRQYRPRRQRRPATSTHQKREVTR